jgi:alpha-1,6-mannosyltransferase
VLGGISLLRFDPLGLSGPIRDFTRDLREEHLLRR